MFATAREPLPGQHARRRNRRYCLAIGDATTAVCSRAPLVSARCVHGIWREMTARHRAVTRRDESQEGGNGAGGLRSGHCDAATTTTCVRSATNTIGKFDVYVLTRDHKMAFLDDVLSGEQPVESSRADHRARSGAAGPAVRSARATLYNGDGHTGRALPRVNAVNFPVLVRQVDSRVCLARGASRAHRVPRHCITIDSAAVGVSDLRPDALRSFLPQRSLPTRTRFHRTSALFGRTKLHRSPSKERNNHAAGR